MTLSDISGMYTVFPRIVSAETILFWNLKCDHYSSRECVRNLDLRVQVHPGELWISKHRVHIVLEASKSAGAKGGVPKICGFMHSMAIRVVEFSNGGYKIRKIFA